MVKIWRTQSKKENQFREQHLEFSSVLCEVHCRKERYFLISYFLSFLLIPLHKVREFNYTKACLHCITFAMLNHIPEIATVAFIDNSVCIWNLDVISKSDFETLTVSSYELEHELWKRQVCLSPAWLFCKCQEMPQLIYPAKISQAYSNIFHLLSRINVTKQLTSY